MVRVWRPHVYSTVSVGLNGPNIMVDCTIVFVENRLLGTVVLCLYHGLVDFEMPAFFSGSPVIGVQISIDGRQKHKVFHFPILQVPRNLRRGQPRSKSAGGPI